MTLENASRRLASRLPTHRTSCVFSHGAGAGVVGGLRESYTGSSRALYEHAVERGCPAVWLHASRRFDFAAGRALNFRSVAGALAAARAHVSVGGSNNGAPWPLLSDRTWVVQCWHGTPLKRIGRAWPGSDPRDLRIIERADFFVSSGPEYSARFRRCYEVPDDRMWETGNPRNDRLVRATGEQRTALIDRLRRATGQESIERVILYAPTWREWLERPSFLPLQDRDLSALRAFLRSTKALLVLRSHHREARAALQAGMHDGPIVVSDALDLPWDVNDWLIASDVLVTDYSSIFFDYAVMDRPVIHVPYDLIEYGEHRGFMVDPWEDFAGPAVFTQRELVERLEEALCDPTAHRNLRARLNAIHNPLEDGRATERVWARIERLFGIGPRDHGLVWHEEGAAQS